MCFVISVIAFIYALSQLNAGNYTLAAVGFVVALFFILLLSRNIYKTYQERKNNDH